MELQNEPVLTNPHDRSEPLSNETTQSSDFRPFIIEKSNSLPQCPTPTAPTLIVEPNSEPTMTVEETQPASEPIQVEEEGTEQEDTEEEELEPIACLFCGVTVEANMMEAHIEDCDLRKVACDKCEERIPIDHFDAHYEECEGNMEMEGINMSYEERRRMSLPDGSFTYEQLLLLDNNVVKRGMSAEEIKKFPVALYVKSLDGEGTCTVCFCEYETGEYTRKLGCRHRFHQTCIDKWMETNIACPVCKKFLR